MEYITLYRASEIVNCTWLELFLMCNECKMPFYIINGLYMFKEKELIDFINYKRKSNKYQMTTDELFKKVENKEMTAEEANKQLLFSFNVRLTVCQYCGSKNLTTDGHYIWCLDCDMEQTEI